MKNVKQFHFAINKPMLNVFAILWQYKKEENLVKKKLYGFSAVLPWEDDTLTDECNESTENTVKIDNWGAADQKNDKI